MFFKKSREAAKEEGRNAAIAFEARVLADKKDYDERSPFWIFEYRSVKRQERIPAFSRDSDSLAAWDEEDWELVSETLVPDLLYARDIGGSGINRSTWAYVFRRKVEKG